MIDLNESARPKPINMDDIADLAGQLAKRGRWLVALERLADLPRPTIPSRGPGVRAGGAYA